MSKDTSLERPSEGAWWGPWGGEAFEGQTRKADIVYLHFASRGQGGWTCMCSDWPFPVKHDAKHFAHIKIPVVAVVFSPFARKETEAQRIK